MHLLIVDDSWAMRKFILKQIAACGSDVETCLEAADGQEALEALEKHRVDVVLTDINMPNMNGLELARAMRADERFQGVPVIVVSSDAASARMADFEPLGAIGYIEKPFTPRKLLGEIERLLGLAQAALQTCRRPTP